MGRETKSPGLTAYHGCAHHKLLILFDFICMATYFITGWTGGSFLPVPMAGLELVPLRLPILSSTNQGATCMYMTQDVGAYKHEENNNSICISETQEVSADKQGVGANKHEENNNSICDKYNENRKATGKVKASKSNRKSKYVKKRDRKRNKLSQTPNVNESFSESVNSQHQSSPTLSPIHVTPRSQNSMLASPSETENGEMQTLVTSCMLPTMNPTQGELKLLQAQKLILLANIKVQELETSRNDMRNDLAATKAGLLIMEEELKCLISIQPPQIKGKAAKSQLVKQDVSRKQLKLLEQENLNFKDEIKRYRGSTKSCVQTTESGAES